MVKSFPGLAESATVKERSLCLKTRKLQSFILKNKLHFITLLVILNLLIAVKGRGGIILLSNVFYGASILILTALVICEWKNQQNSKSKTNLWLLLFLCFFFASFFFALNKGYGLSELLLFTSSASIFLYIANTTFSKNHLSQISTLKKGLIIFSIATILFGFYVYLTYPYDRFASFFYNFEDKFIGYPNALADMLLIIFPLIFLGKNKHLKYLGAILFIAALILTFSRGAYLAFIAELILIAWIYSKEVFKFKKLGATLLVGLIAFSLSTGAIWLKNAGDILEEKITLEADEKASSVNERFEFFQGSLEIIKDFPVWGVGSDGFQFIYPRYQETAFATSNHPHNLFLKIAVENGIPAAISLLLFFIFVIWKGFFSKEKTKQLMSVGIIALIAHNMIDYNLNFVPNILLLFLFAGLIVNGSSQSSKKQGIAISIIILSISIAGLSMHEGYYNYLSQQGRSALSTKQYQKALPLLQKAEGLIFPRRLYSSLAEAAKDNKELAIQYAQKAIDINPDDAHAYNALGELTNIEENFSKAISKDPKNFLRFHSNYLASKKELNKAETEKYTDMLKHYLIVLKNNQHNTILTDNAKYSIKIAETLHEKTDDSQFKELAKKLRDLKNIEEEKFKERFLFSL